MLQLRGPLARAATTTLSRSSSATTTAAPRVAAVCQYQQQQTRAQSAAAASGGAAQHAISNPTLADIERRWEDMPPQEQADLWMALRDRMKNNWNELTTHEKKAAYWIAFGPHGPRKEPEPGEGMYIFSRVLLALVASGIIFGVTRHFARPAPRSMTKEWQEKSNEYMKEQNMNPISGISSEGYQGKGMLQSKSAKELGIKLEPDEE